MPCGRVCWPRSMRRRSCPLWASYTPTVWPGVSRPYSLTTAVRPSRLTMISCGAGAVAASPTRRPSSSDRRHRVSPDLFPTSRVPWPAKAMGLAAARASTPASRSGNARAMPVSPSGRIRRAAGRIRMQPLCRAIGVALVFPDRHPGLHLVDDVAAGVERRIAVGGAGADPDRQAADRQLAHPVHALHPGDGEACHGLLHDAPSLLQGQRRIGLVAQAIHRPAVVMVADPALEAGVGAGLVAQQALTQRGDLERDFGQLEAGEAG